MAIALSDVQLGEVIRSGTGSEVRLGRARGISVLVTRTAGHAAPLLGYELAHERIAPLAYLDSEVLVESLPPGRPAPELGVLEVEKVRAIGARIAHVLDRIHRDGIVLDGIYPELVYLDDDARLIWIVPRGPRFIATANTQLAGPGTYPLPYVGYECIALGKPSSAASDVFALCATLFLLRTGRHPFGESLGEILPRIMADEPDKLDGPFGALIARGLGKAPGDRPTPSELVVALTS